MKLELPAKKKLVHEMRIAWFGTCGITLSPLGDGPVIINAFCTFHKQLEYPCDVLGKMYASDLGRSSFETWATLERVDDPGVIYASGGGTTVWVDFPAQKSKALPEWFRAKLE